MNKYELPRLQDFHILGGAKPTQGQLLDLEAGKKPRLFKNQILCSPKQWAAHEALTRVGARYINLVGGTRSGKTFMAMRAVLGRAIMAPETRHACLRFRANAARASIGLDTLPTVMRVCYPGVKTEEHRQEGFFELPNGSQIWVGGLDDKERIEKILGTEFITIFLNEASQIPYSSYLVAMTRLAQTHEKIQQKAIVDLNPVGKSHWTNMLWGEGKDPISKQPIRNTNVYVRAFLNPVDNAHNLSREYIESLDSMAEKQRKRFFEGIYVDEVEGALWNYELLEQLRCDADEIPISSRQRVVIAVDPSGAKSLDDNSSDEIGICAMAKGLNGHGYVLEDASMRGSPNEWAAAAIACFRRHQADLIVAEGNFGGAMVEATLKAVDPNVPVKIVTASRGKVVRAEPISALYEARKMHHVGKFPKLEDQMCAFSSAGYGGADSPDHADAMVWAATELFGSPDGGAMIEFYRRLAEQRKEGEFNR